MDKKILRPLIWNLEYERLIDSVESLKEKVFINDVLEKGIDKSYFGDFFDYYVTFRAPRAFLMIQAPEERIRRHIWQQTTKMKT